MGNEPGAPVFFTKPADAVVEDGAAIRYPLHTSDFHHEVELVVAIARGGVEISEADALTHVYGYAVGVDLTRRDRQAEAKDKGAPWDVAKGFDESAPVGAITRAEQSGHLARGRIALSVNGASKQNGELGDMIWNVPQIIAHVSRSWALMPGDLIFTGTPHGVGPLKPGDAVLAEIDGLTPLRFQIVPR